MKNSQGPVDVTGRLARYAATLQYDDLPREAVTLAKQVVLDTLGVAIAASTLAPEGRLIADYVKVMGGHPSSTVLGFGGKVPAPCAAYVNGGLAHMLDYDSTGDGGHASVATVPVAFAAAENAGCVCGRDLIAAVVCGSDIHTRLAQSISLPEWAMTEGWLPTQLLGYISGAAAAGRVSGLTEAQMVNAFGIAFNQMSGSRQMTAGAATDMRSMQAGFSGHGAILSTDLARLGIVGPKEILEGRYGFYKTYVRVHDPDWDAIVGGLGSRFSFLKTHAFKVWPACGITRVTNAATLQLRQEWGIDPTDVDSITVIGCLNATRLLCEPLEAKRRPQTSTDAKYSIPFTTAVMLVRGNVTLADYTESGLADPIVLATADKVCYREVSDRAEGEFNGRGSAGTIGRTSVEIRTKNGKSFTCTPDSVPGDPNQPMSQDLLEAKFRDCVSFSARPIAGENASCAIDMIRHLEDVSDVSELMQLLV